jgi:prepilin-type N-terminal cleavage/methylation domain-containing protein
MNSRGFTLVELMIVIAMAGILMAVATLNFNSMLRKSQIDKQTREIVSDLVSLRIDAMQKKRRSAAFLGPKQIKFKSYSSAAENILTGGTDLSTKPLSYSINMLIGATLTTPVVTADYVDYDTRGFATFKTGINSITIVALPVQYGGGDNCILVNPTLTNIGRMVDASTCTAR